MGILLSLDNGDDDEDGDREEPAKPPGRSTKHGAFPCWQDLWCNK